VQATWVLTLRSTLLIPKAGQMTSPLGVLTTGTGLGFTCMVFDAVSVGPPQLLSVAVTLRGKDPEPYHVCVGVAELLVLPSPKSQLKTALTAGVTDKVRASPSQSELGPTMLNVGIALTVTVLVLLTVLPHTVAVATICTLLGALALKSTVTKLLPCPVMTLPAVAGTTLHCKLV
jgi:hypothetical protein